MQNSQANIYIFSTKFATADGFSRKALLTIRGASPLTQTTFLLFEKKCNTVAFFEQLFSEKLK